MPIKAIVIDDHSIARRGMSATARGIAKIAICPFVGKHVKARRSPNPGLAEMYASPGAVGVEHANRHAIAADGQPTP